MIVWKCVNTTILELLVYNIYNYDVVYKEHGNSVSLDSTHLVHDLVHVFWD